jgi:hypothetical protein
MACDKTRRIRASVLKSPPRGHAGGNSHLIARNRSHSRLGQRSDGANTLCRFRRRLRADQWSSRSMSYRWMGIKLNEWTRNFNVLQSH